MYVNDHQQIIDAVLKAFLLAEQTSIPVMVCYDGYLLSHTYMPFEVPDQAQADAFLPPYRPDYVLDPERPANLNTVTLPEPRPDVHGRMAHGYMEIRYLLQEDLRGALDAASQVENRFQDTFGRSSDPYVETYRCDDAEFIAVALGSLSYQLRDVAEILRKEGLALGVASVRLYRPFPDQQIAAVLKKARRVVVFEKALSYGYEGALSADIKAALYNTPKRPELEHFILGLGGREIRTADLEDALRHACTRGKEAVPAMGWIGLKI